VEDGGEEERRATAEGQEDVSYPSDTRGWYRIK